MSDKIIARLHRTHCDSNNMLRVTVQRETPHPDQVNREGDYEYSNLWTGFERIDAAGEGHAIIRAREYADIVKLPFRIERTPTRNCGEPECPHCEWTGRPHTWI